MGKCWLQQLLAKAGAQSGFLKCCSDSSVFECRKNCSFYSWSVDCIHLQQYFHFLNLGPCVNLWCAIPGQYPLFPAKWVHPEVRTHTIMPWFPAFGTPDWWSNSLSCWAAPGTTQQLLEEQWKNQPSTELPAQTDPTEFGSLPCGSTKMKELMSTVMLGNSKCNTWTNLHSDNVPELPLIFSSSESIL